MTSIYRESHRQLQDRFDTRRLADRLDERIVHDRLTDKERDFIERQDMFFLATADAEGRPNCSYKGGDPGFVRAVDERTVAFPSWDGNGMYLSAGNLLENPSSSASRPRPTYRERAARRPSPTGSAATSRAAFCPRTIPLTGRRYARPGGAGGALPGAR